jgi:hypothetical protein
MLYRNIQPYGTVREMRHASAQQYCGGELVHLAQMITVFQVSLLPIQKVANHQLIMLME